MGSLQEGDKQEKHTKAHNDTTDPQQDRKSGSAGMPRPSSYAVCCLKKKNLAGGVGGRGGGEFDGPGGGGGYREEPVRVHVVEVRPGAFVGRELVVVGREGRRRWGERG